MYKYIYVHVHVKYMYMYIWYDRNNCKPKVALKLWTKNIGPV